MSTDESQARLLAELKLHNEQILSEHKRMLEEQFSAQLQQILQHLRPPQPAQLQTKLALNHVQADERIDLINKRAASLETAPTISIFDGGLKTQVIRMSKASTNEPSRVVSRSSAEVLAGDEYKDGGGNDDSDDGRHARVKRPPPLHPSLKNSIYSKPVASSGQLKAIARAKSEKIKEKEIVVRKHNQRESVVPDVDAEEAEALVGKMDSQTQYMLKKTAFLLDDSSKAVNAAQKKLKTKSKGKKKRIGRGHGHSNGDVGFEDEEWEEGEGEGEGEGEEEEEEEQQKAMRPSHPKGRPVLNSAGFNSMFAEPEAKEGSTGRAGQGQGHEVEEGGEIEDNVVAGRNASSQAPRRTLPIGDSSSNGSSSSRGTVVFGEALVLPPVDGALTSLGSSRSRPSSAAPALKPSSRPSSAAGAAGAAAGGGGGGEGYTSVEIDDRERLFPLIPGAGAGLSTGQGGGLEESKGLPEGWENQRVNSYAYSVDPHLQNNHTEWANEIARHILSVYATARVSNAPEGSQRRHEAEYVMDFVDVHKSETVGSVKSYVLSEDGLGPGPRDGAELGGYEWEDYMTEEEEEAMALSISGPSPPKPKFSDKYGLQIPRGPAGFPAPAKKAKQQTFGGVVHEAQEQALASSALGEGVGAAALDEEEEEEEVAEDEEEGEDLQGGGSLASVEQQSLCSSAVDAEEARDAFPSPAPPFETAPLRASSSSFASPSAATTVKADAGSPWALSDNALQHKRDALSRGASRGALISAQSDASAPILQRSTAGRLPKSRAGRGESGMFAVTGAAAGGGGGGSPQHRPPGTVTAQEAGLTYQIEESFRKTSKFRSVTLVKNPDGEEVALRGTPRCFAIWFVSTGDVYTRWDRLPGGAKVQAHLTDMHEKRQFKEYLGVIETIIDSTWKERKLGKLDLADFANKRKSTRPRVVMAPGVLVDRTRTASPTRERVNAGNPLEPLSMPGGSGIIAPSDMFPQGIDLSASLAGRSTSDGSKAPYVASYADEDANSIWTQQKRADEEMKAAADYVKDQELVDMWGQLILTANALGILCVERKRADLGLEILAKAEKWCNRNDILSSKQQRNTLRAHVQDSIAFYFYKKGKSMSATSYTNLALEVHEHDGNVEAVGVSLLHLAAIQTQQGNFKGAHKTLYQFLTMVEDGRLSFEEATPKQLCLVAVAYHNLAVVQLKLLVPDLACKSSQNARKIARLCLSYSNRWMHVFQWTHDLALEDVRFQLTLKPGIPLTAKQLEVIKTLTMDMYND